jgi:hypothetical protein
MIWRRIAGRLGVALTMAVVVLPVVAWLVTGSVGLFSVVYAAEVVLGVTARYVARSIGLPSWSANESYISRLRRWQADRHAGPDGPPASRPS